MDLGHDTATLHDAAEAACRAGLRRGLREADARDLAQEALVRALGPARPPDGVPLAAWVYGIARNLGRDRAKAASTREVLVDVAPEPANPGDDLATVLAVRAAVRELPEPLRDVVTLHELEERTLRETAAVLDIPFDTAKDCLRRAREQLRAQLGDADLGAERAHTRRRAAAQAGAVVAAVWAALAARSASAAGAAAAAVRASGWAVRGWLAVAVGGALVAGGFAGGFATGRLTARPRDAREPARVATAPAVEPAPPAPTTLDAAVAPASDAAAAPPAHRPAPTAPPPPATGTIHDAERLVLDRARAALQRGLPDEALVALMSHERQFPSGALAEERDVMIIEAYVRAGNADLAQRRIERYRAAYPAGALRARVDQLAGQR